MGAICSLSTQRGQDSPSVLQNDTGTCPSHRAKEGGSRMSTIQDTKQNSGVVSLALPPTTTRAIANHLVVSLTLDPSHFLIPSLTQ